MKKFEEIIEEVYPVDITPTTTIEQRVHIIGKLQSDSWKVLPILILAILSWIWVIAGTQISDEPNVFVGLIIFSIASYLSAFIYAVFFISKNGKEYIQTTRHSLKGGMKLVGKGVPDTKVINIIDRIVRIGVVSYILYYHFI